MVSQNKIFLRRCRGPSIADAIYLSKPTSAKTMQQGGREGDKLSHHHPQCRPPPTPLALMSPASQIQKGRREGQARFCRGNFRETGRISGKKRRAGHHASKKQPRSCHRPSRRRPRPCPSERGWRPSSFIWRSLTPGAVSFCQSQSEYGTTNLIAWP